MPDAFENPILKSVDTEAQLVALGSPDSASQPALPPVQQKRLHLCRKILFGMAAPPLQMTGNICGFFFSLYLLEVVHMSPLLVSVITFAGRAWDAVTDPLVGQFVFRTNTRIGSTKPWLIFATIFGPITFFLMWLTVPGIESEMQRFLYYLFCYLAYCALITCYHVPYTSSTVLISNHSKDRDGATAARIGFELIFTIIGSGVFGVIICQKRLASNCEAAATMNETALEDRIVAERQGYMIAAGVISAIYMACGIFAVVGINELVRQEKRKDLKDSFCVNIRSVLRFRPYLLLMSAFLFMSLGIQIVQANLGLYTTHSVGLGSHMNFGIMTVLSVAVLSVPFWYKLADRFGKKIIFICGLIPMFPCLMFATIMPAESKLCYYIVCAVSGLSISVAMLLPWSMLPDVIDDYYVRFGDRKESVFYSLYVFFTKFASGISLALSQLALSASSYNSKSCTQPESVGIALRYLVGPGPVVCIAIAMGLMWLYPIDKPYRAELNRKLAKKFAAGGGSLSESSMDDDNDDDKKRIVCTDAKEAIVLESQVVTTVGVEVADSQENMGQTQQQLQKQQDACSNGSAGSGSSDSGLAEEMTSTDSLLRRHRHPSGAAT